MKSEVWEKVEEVEKKITEINLNGSVKLDDLQADADSVSKALKELGQQLEYMKISNVRGMFITCVLFLFYKCNIHFKFPLINL